MTDLTDSGGGKDGLSALEVLNLYRVSIGQAPLDDAGYAAYIVGPPGVIVDPNALPWDAETIYAVSSLVTYSGSVWIAIRSTAGDTPETGSDAWNVFIPGVDIALYNELLAAVEDIRLQAIEDTAAQVALANTARVGAETAETNAELAQAAAELALAETEAVAATAGRFESTAAGLAGTTVGETFWVYDGQYLSLYRHDAGPVATDLDNQLPLAPVVEAAVAQVDAIDVQTQGVRARSRSAPMGYLWAIIDAMGKAAFGITRDGDAAVTSLLFRQQTIRRSVLRPGAVRDALGRIASWYDPQTGEFAVAGGIRFAPKKARRKTKPFAWSVADEDGRVAIGVRASGEVDLIPSPEAIARFGGGYIAQSQFSTYDVANVRSLGGGTLVALRQEPDMVVQDVRQITSYSVAVAEHRNALQVLLFYGQSNAGNVGVTNAVITDPLFPHNCLTYYGLLEGFRNTPSNPDLYVGIEPLRDAADEPPFPATMTGFAYEGQARAETGHPTQGVFAFTSWYGGQPLTAFERGTVPWDNMMIGASKAVDVAALYGREVECPGIVWIQGEHGPFTGYKALMIALAADITGELQTQMGLASAPEFFVVQTSEYDDAASSDTVFQDQFEAARDTAGITMLGPMYHCPLDDAIHLSPIGRMVLGDTLAAAIREFEANGSFEPLWPASASLVGANVTITFNRPVARDADWVLTVDDDGFVVRDDSGTTAINSVNLSGSEVTLVLASAPAGANPRVEYAVYTDTTAENGWSNGRGLIYSPTTIPSYYAALGYDVPDMVRHYAVRFIATL